MSPMEEIENSIEAANNSDCSFDIKIMMLGELYQARAIERLEATVRAMAVMLCEVLPSAQKPTRPAPQLVKVKHLFSACTLGDEVLPVCEHCGLLEDNHPVGFPKPDYKPGTCAQCTEPLGGQHKPSCSRQGIVSERSIRA